MLPTHIGQPRSLRPVVIVLCRSMARTRSTNRAFLYPARSLLYSDAQVGNARD